MIDWGNDSLFFTHTYIDETSKYDPHPSTHFSPGNDCYMRTFAVRVPISIKDEEDVIERWINMFIDLDYENEGFWID